MENPLTPVQPTEADRPSTLSIAMFTGLVGALVSLIFAILRLRRLQETQLSGQYANGTAIQEQPAAWMVLDGTIGQGVLPVQDQPGHAQPAGPTAATRWQLTTKYVVGVGLFLALLFVIYLSRSSLGMIIFAALLAFIIQPVIDFLQQRWMMKRGPAIGLAYLVVIALLILMPLVMIPALVKSANGLLSVDWQTIGQNTAAALQTVAQNSSTIPLIGPLIASSLDTIAQVLLGAAKLPAPEPIVVDVSAASLGGQLANTLGKLVKILGPAVSAFVSLIFMLLISLRISLAADEMRAAYPKLIPPAYGNEITALVERILKIWSSFLRGQLSLMVIMGFLTYLLNLLLGTPSALFLGILAGALEIVPSLGPVLATIPAVLLALVMGSSYLPVSNLAFAILVILGYVLLSGLENQLIVPKVLGDAVDLHPLVVIVGCVIGGAVFGLLGVFLATPVISTGKEIFSYLYNKILEPPPVIEPPEVKPSLMDNLRGLRQRIHLPIPRRKGQPAPVQAPGSKNEPAAN